MPLIDVLCINCNKEFSTEKRYIKRGGGKFCSLKCSVAYQKNKSPLGMSSARCRNRARLVYIERNGIPACNHCGKVPADVHHLNEDMTDNSPENLIALCRSCHTAYHNHKEPKRQQAVNE